ncbi:MAG: hypothetical protein WBD22_07760 [Pyrinomonadaceae bacterium]
MHKKDETKRRFEELYWHDSRIVGLSLEKDDEAKKFDLRINVDLFEKDSIGKLARTARLIIFEHCRVIQIDFDLVGLLMCRGDISNAECFTDAVRLEKDRRGKLKNFDFPDGHNPLTRCLGFAIEMIHPAGGIAIFARDFEVV